MSVLHSCQCSHCLQEADHPFKILHEQINLLLSRLDEQQRRWFVALESNLHPEITDLELCLITGLDPKTIRRGREELAQKLEGRPVGAVRLPGGGRPFVEKKARDLNGPHHRRGEGDSRRSHEQPDMGQKQSAPTQSST